MVSYSHMRVLRVTCEGDEHSSSHWAQTQHNARIKHLRSDRGGEFTSNKFTAYLEQQGTERRLTTADMS